jgi:hypothetical protein
MHSSIIDDNNLETREINKTDNANLFLTVFKCESCNNEIVVQIDDYKTFALLQKQKELNMLLGMEKYYHSENTKKYRKLKNRLCFVSHDLLERRKMLNNEYNNQFYYFCGKEYKISIGQPITELIKNWEM